MDVFDRHLPPMAVAYARQLWQQHPFRLRVVLPRRTRFGDFKATPDGDLQITVNADLAPPAFLLTYIHEVAHRLVYHKYTSEKALYVAGQRVLRPARPHGPVWQQTFQQLMAPLLTEANFSAEVLPLLRHYMNTPAATLSRHPDLARLLRPGSAPARPDATTVGQLAEGQTFGLGKKTFVRGKLRRSRIVCTETATGRQYAILPDAAVVRYA
jgi:hypothetical protein